VVIVITSKLEIKIIEIIDIIDLMEGPAFITIESPLARIIGNDLFKPLA